MRRSMALVCLLVTSLVFGACSSQPDGESGTPSTQTGTPTGTPAAPTPAALADSITIAAGVVPSHLDRQVGTGSSALVNVMLNYNVTETLLKVGPEGEILPYLAESWEETAPGTMRFHLRQGVTFSDGSPWNAEVAKANFDRMLSIEGSAAETQFPSLTGATVADEYSIDVSHDPDPSFPGYFTLLAWFYSGKQIQEDPESIATGPIGTGAYTVTSFDANGLVLEARDGYWGKTPSLKKATFVFRPEPGARVAMLQAGEADLVLDLPPDNVAGLDPAQVIGGVGFETYYLRLGFDDELTSDPRVRQAINLAIDRSLLIGLFSGYADPTDGNQVWPSSVTGWAPRPAITPDLAQATALIQEAGATGKVLKLGTGVGRRLFDGEVAEAVSAMIEETGLQVDLYKGSHDWFRENFRITDPAYPGLFGAVGWEIAEASREFPAKFMCGGEQASYCSEEFDALAAQALAEIDPVKRTAIVQQAVDVLDKDLPYISLLTPQVLYGKNLKLSITFLPGGLLSLPDMELAQ